MLAYYSLIFAIKWKTAYIFIFFLALYVTLYGNIYLRSEKGTNTLVIYRKINTLAACIIIENFSRARKISECRQQMHLLENEKSIRSLPKPVRQRNSKILLAVIYSARRQQFSSRGFFKPKWLTLVITFLSHGIFRCSRIRSARRVQLEDVSSLDFPPAKIRPV